MFTLFFILVSPVFGSFTNLHCVGNTSVIVHLFEWKWSNIEKECPFLAQAGYCAVQTSVVTENKFEVSRPWWERYQPVSYKLDTRSGSEEEFVKMVTACNDLGVRIINDVVLNHMARGGVGVGVAGSFYNGTGLSYPSVPYNASHFHTTNDCSEPTNQINNASTSDDLRHCQLLYLPDLDQSQDYVRSKIIELLNSLVAHGSVGFRVDAAKHIHPSDLKYIYENVNNLTTGGRPLVINEVVNTVPDGITSDEYFDLGLVTEFRYSEMIGEALSKKNYSNLCDVFKTLLKEENALLFIDNHDTQRGRERPGSIILNYKSPELYTRAQAFTLAAGYGTQRVMSSYIFTDTEAGPPADSNDHIMDVVIRPSGICGNGWVCEHRWPVIQKMVQFSNLVKGSQLTNCQATTNTVSFRRGNDALFWMSSADIVVPETFLTNLTKGVYCDLMTDCITKYTVDDHGSLILTLSNGGLVVLVPENSINSTTSIESSTISLNYTLTTSAYLNTTDQTWTTDNSTSPWNATEPTAPPGPDWRRTVIFVQKQTNPGQDVFIRGGIDHTRLAGTKTCETYDFEHNPCVIPIKHRTLDIKEPTPARDAWSLGDNYLDWFGAEPNQGKNGQQPAQGTPGQWTSSDPTGKYYDPLNTYGDHYWIMDVDMDCSKTFQGFFEFKGVLSNGWEVGSSLDIDCTGDGATPFPYHAGNHIGRCGFANVYHWGSGLCEIHALPTSSLSPSVVIG